MEEEAETRRRRHDMQLAMSSPYKHFEIQDADFTARPTLSTLTQGLPAQGCLVQDVGGHTRLTTMQRLRSD